MRWNLALLMVLAVLALVQTVAAWEEGTFFRNKLNTSLQDSMHTTGQLNDLISKKKNHHLAQAQCIDSLHIILLTVGRIDRRFRDL